MKVALITGASRGLGFETGRQLALQGYHVYLGTRKIANTTEALSKLPALKGKLEPLEMDFEDPEMENKLATFFSNKDFAVLVNNAGMFPGHLSDARSADDFSTPLPDLRETFEVNVLSAIRLSQKLIPLMIAKKYGRVVNVSSGMGQLSEMNTGYAAYRLSKTALNAVTRIFSNHGKRSNVLVNSVCPGWVRTDMGGATAPRSVEKGASGIVWAATLPDSGPNGGFFRDGEPMAW